LSGKNCTILPPSSSGLPCYQGKANDIVKCDHIGGFQQSGATARCGNCEVYGYGKFTGNDPICPTVREYKKTSIDPKKFPWKEVYTAYPQNVILAENAFQCKSDFALCYYANCTVVHGSNPLVARCGCINATEYAKTHKNESYLITEGYAGGILSAEFKQPTAKACKSFDGIPAIGKDTWCYENVNAAPFCKGMNPTEGANSKPHMFDNIFPLISTSSYTIPPTAFSTKQGFPGQTQRCTKKGHYALCFSAACDATPYINPPPSPTSGDNLPVYPITCYCPVYTTNAMVQLPGSLDNGYNCQGQGPIVGGIPTYVQNGV